MELGPIRPRDGDILIWSDSFKGQSRYGALIRFFTASDYTHCGIALWQNGELYVAEANIPHVRIVKVKPEDRVYFIETGIDLDDKGWAFFRETMGLKYSYLDAIRSVLGITLKNDNKWQCAEYVVEFLKIYGIELGTSPTPSKVVREAMRKLHAPLRKLYR